MEDLVGALAALRGERVLITGDTGFKGSWLALWLAEAGAQVYGCALPPETASSGARLSRISMPSSTRPSSTAWLTGSDDNCERG